MLRLGRLLHDFYVQPIDTIGCNHRSDFVLRIQVWQIFVFLLDFVSIGSKYIVTQMIEVHMSMGNPSRSSARWLVFYFGPELDIPAGRKK